MKTLKDVKVGDTVYRYLAGKLEMPLKVTAITMNNFVCGSWEFDLKTGAEVDEDLNWGPSPLMTGSFITAEKRNG